MPVVHGFVEQGTIVVPATRLVLILIARRSNRYGGTRFLKRGANVNGDVANDVETEQIVWDTNGSLDMLVGKFTGYVQRRGSVPLRWSQAPQQRPAVVMAKPPPIHIDFADPYAACVGQHMA
jgi:hypothetical protein